VGPQLTELNDMVEAPVANQTARALLLASLGFVRGNTTAALASCHDISQPLRGINLRVLLDWIQLPEIIR